MERLGREKVLIVLHSDGWVEAYAEDRVDVWIVNKPHVTTERAGALADEFLDVSLPYAYARLFWPGMLRKSLLLEKLTPITLQLQRWWIDLLRSLEQPDAENKTESLPMPRKPHVDQSSVE